MFYVWSIVSVGLGAVYLNYLITNECHTLLGLIGVGFILGKTHFVQYTVQYTV